jgi:hypothetical protein
MKELIQKGLSKIISERKKRRHFRLRQAITSPPRFLNPQTTLEKAIDQIKAWQQSPRLVLIAESKGCWPLLYSFLMSGKGSGQWSMIPE